MSNKTKAPDAGGIKGLQKHTGKALNSPKNAFRIATFIVAVGDRLKVAILALWLDRGFGLDSIVVLLVGLMLIWGVL